MLLSTQEIEDLVVVAVVAPIGIYIGSKMHAFFKGTNSSVTSRQLHPEQAVRPNATPQTQQTLPSKLRP
jgi:hypothetical protein